MPGSVSFCWGLGYKVSVQGISCLYFIYPCIYVRRHFTVIWFLVPISHRSPLLLWISHKVYLRDVCAFLRYLRYTGFFSHLNGDCGKVHQSPLSRHPDSTMSALCPLPCCPEHLSYTTFQIKHRSPLLSESLNQCWIFIPWHPTNESWWITPEPQTSCLQSNSYVTMEFLFGKKEIKLNLTNHLFYKETLGDKVEHFFSMTNQSWCSYQLWFAHDSTNVVTVA